MNLLKAWPPTSPRGTPAPPPITAFLLGWVNRSGLSREWKRVPVWSLHSSAAPEDSIRGHGRISHTQGHVMSVCVCADNTQGKWNKTDGFSLEELRDQHKQEQKPTSLQQTSLKEQRSAFKHDLTGLGTRPKPKVQADT